MRLSDGADGTSATTPAEPTFLSVVQSSPFGIYVVDAEFRLVQISIGCQSAFSGIEPLIGRDFSEILRIVWPEPFATEALSHFRHTLSTGEAFHSPATTEQRGNIAVIESYDWQLARVTMPDGRFGVACYFYETTTRVNAEQDARLLADLAERCRTARDWSLLLQEAVRVLGVFMHTDRCFVTQIFEDQDRWTVADDYHAGDRSLAGTYHLSDYDLTARVALSRGVVEVNADTKADARSAARFATAYEPLGDRAHVIVPLLREGRWVATFVVTSERPRRWQPREIALLETAADRLWTAVQKLRFDAELRDERQFTHNAEAALRQERELVRTINDSTSDLIFMKDLSGRLTYANAATRRVMGGGEQSRSGENDQTVMREGRVLEIEETITSPDGKRRVFLSRKTPLRDPAGEIVGVIGVSRDITERKEAEDRLRASEMRAELVREATQVGFWFCDLPFDTLIWDARVKDHFWLPHDATVTIDTFYAQLHPDDRERTRQAIDESIANHTAYDIEYRTRSSDADEKWIRAIGRTFYDPQSNPVRFDGVTLDITDRKAAEEALLENDQRKDQFLAMLAHELRNPLAPIRHAAQVLKSLGTADAGTPWAGEVIERQTQHLTRLVDDLLDVSRFTQGKITLHREALELSKVIDRAVEANRPLADACHQQLIVTIPATPVSVNGDLTRLVQVVSNLLNNAIKYTPDGGVIAIEATSEEGTAVVRVRDNGVGIPPELLHTIFNLFSQVDRSLDRSQGGLGIGLTLVQSIVGMHGGTVEARSAGEQRGSEFIVRLPLAPDTTAAARAMPPLGDGDVANPGVRQPLRVLIIEDNNDAAEVLGFLLRGLGHEIRLAFDGETGLDAAAQFDPHVILCDLGLPGVDGYAIAERVRARPSSAGVKLIALSGYGQVEDKRRAAVAGFDDYLVKPVEPSVLFRLFDSLHGKLPNPG